MRAGAWLISRPVETLVNPITLSQIKQDERLQEMALVKQSRLSVMPVTRKEFALIVKKGRAA